jgi:hypothetical protein
MLHWDGKRWSHARLSGSGETELAGIAVLSPTVAVAVSSNPWSYEEQGSGGFATWRRAGSTWRATELPHGWELYDVVVAPARAGAPPVVWAVGQLGTGITDYATRTVPLIRRYGC